MVHAVRTDREKRAYALLLDGLRSRGTTFTVIAWDRGRSVLDLDALGPVGEIEAINRWRLPIWLAKSGLRPVARWLRHARIKWWWARARRPQAVLVLGPIRPEMRHYARPGTPVGALLGWREPEPPESLAVTLQLADTVVALDEATARRCRQVDAGVDVEVFEHLWPLLRWSVDPPDPPAVPAALGVDPSSAFVLGLGPIDWAGGADQFLAAAWRVRATLADRPVEFGWVGGHPHGPDFHPYRFDTARLGLTEVMHWFGERDDFSEIVRRADVVLITCRRPFSSAYDPIVASFAGSFSGEARYLEIPFAPLPDPLPALLEMLETPVVHYDLPAANQVIHDLGESVTYPDAASLARAVVTCLRRPGRKVVDRAVAHLIGPAIS